MIPEGRSVTEELTSDLLVNANVGYSFPKEGGAFGLSCLTSAGTPIWTCFGTKPGRD